MLKIYFNQVDRDGLRLTGSLSPYELGLFNESSYSFPEDISYNLLARQITGGIVLEGSLVTSILCVCARCLKKFAQKVIIPDVMHFYEKSDKEEIDLTNDINEDILITFPQNFICSDECKGLCPVCGNDKNTKDCACKPQDSVNNNWDDLDIVISKLKERK